jgi:hypothetical protein
MSIGADVDAEVDLGPLVFELMGGIKASLDSLASAIKKMRDNEEAYQRGAVQVVLRGSAMSDSGSDTLEIGLGGPPYGRLWEVKSLTVGGGLWTTTAAGQALVVVSPARSLTPALTDIVDQAGTLPSVAYYSTRQLVVRHPNHLRVVFLTPTASTQYAVGGQATDLPDRRTALVTES